MEAQAEFDRICERLKAEPRAKSLARAFGKFERAFFREAYPFDTRFNAGIWLFDCFELLMEIGIGYCWMDAYATIQPSAYRSAGFYVNYFAGNCATRIESFRHKAALVAWSYYCPFDPSNKAEVLDFDKVVERLTDPRRHALKLRGREAFVSQLKTLQKECFDQAKMFRDFKIHRLEPRILMQKPTKSDGFSYMVPLRKHKDLTQFEEELESMYPDDHFRARIEASCYVDGVLYDRRQVVGKWWWYDDVKRFTKRCLDGCSEATEELARILTRRAPLRTGP